MVCSCLSRVDYVDVSIRRLQAESPSNRRITPDPSVGTVRETALLISSALFLLRRFRRDQFLEPRHHAVERARVALLGPALLGAHLEPSELDRVGLVAHLAGRNLDHRALLGGELRQHLALEVLQEAGLEVDINFHDFPRRGPSNRSGAWTMPPLYSQSP